VKNAKDIEKTLFAGLKNRKTGETAMNKESSRSHSIFTIYIETAEENTVRRLIILSSISSYFYIFP
jgi:kinesin family protein 3/17